MATGQPGRKYLVEVFDVQTFHARRLGFETHAAPAIGLELGPEVAVFDVVRRELVALLLQLQAERGNGVGLRLCPLGRDSWYTSVGLQLWIEAIELAGLRVLRARDGDPIAVHPSVLTAAGELQGTTAQAAR